LVERPYTLPWYRGARMSVSNGTNVFVNEFPIMARVKSRWDTARLRCSTG